MTTVLIVEDEEILIDLMSHVLSAAGYDVLTAADGAAGISMAREHKPGLILTDMSMPVKTGWELVEAIRSDDATANIPIIALTAHATSGDRDEGHAAGLDDYIEKPVDVAKLLEKISRLVG